MKIKITALVTLLLSFILTACNSGGKYSPQNQYGLLSSSNPALSISICDINNNDCKSTEHPLYFRGNTTNYFKVKIEPKAENTKISNFVFASFAHPLGWQIALDNKLNPVIDVSCIDKKNPLSSLNPCTFMVEYKSPSVNTAKVDSLEIKYSTDTNKSTYAFKAKTFPKSLPEIISVDRQGNYSINISSLKLLKETEFLSFIKTFNSYFANAKMYHYLHSGNELTSYMYSPFKTGIETHALVYIEHPNSNSADNSVITYPSTSIISSGFEIAMDHSFSAIKYFDETTFPTSFNSFKSSLGISDFEMQKIGYLLAAKNIGGSPLQSLWLTAQPDSEQIMINVREANLNSIEYYTSLIRDRLKNSYQIKRGDIFSVKRLFIDTYNIKDASQLQIVDLAFAYIQNPEDINLWRTIKVSMLETIDDQIFFMGTILKISGNHYLGSPAFGGDNPHAAGLILINQIRQHELFNNAEIAQIETRLRVYGLSNEYVNLLFNQSQLAADCCIDIIGSEVFEIARIFAR